MRPRVSVTLSAAELERQRAHLERGTVVVPPIADVAVGAFCDVALAWPSGERSTLAARAVLSTPAGTVLAFDAPDPAALARWLRGGTAAPAPETLPAPDGAAGEPGADGGAQPGDGEAGEGGGAPANVQERLRGLSVTEQLRVARDGSLTERVVLERLYGKVVWEALLRNAHLTVPEVARLARMGTMPRPLLELIAGNPGWLQSPQVRRALLTNPRLSQELVQKVLAALPRDELKQVPQNTAYPATVRMAAKALGRR